MAVMRPTFDQRVAEKLLTRGNSLAVTASQLLAVISAGDEPVLTRDETWRLSCDLRKWAADVRSVAEESHGDDD